MIDVKKLCPDFGIWSVYWNNNWEWYSEEGNLFVREAIEYLEEMKDESSKN